jgi:hypothetical protein
MANEELIQEGLRRAAEEGDKQRAFEKERDDKVKAERKKERSETTKRNAADTYRTQMSQQTFDFGGPEKNTTSQDKSRARTTAKSGASGGSGANPMKTGILSPFNMKKGGKVSSASKRADGCAIRGKTRA